MAEFSCPISTEIYDGLDYQLSKEFDPDAESLKLDLSDKVELEKALAIAPPEFEPMELTPANAIDLKNYVFPTEDVNARKKSRMEAELERSGRSEGSTYEPPKIAKLYGSLGRIIQLSIKASQPNTPAKDSPLTGSKADKRRFSDKFKQMASRAMHVLSEEAVAEQRDEERKAICRRFFKLMNVGDMMGLAKLVSESCSDACSLISPDLIAEIVGRLEVMMLFSLLYEAYPDGIWTVTNTSCEGNTITYHYRFMGTGVVDFPLNTLFMLIRQHSKRYLHADNAEESPEVLDQHQKIVNTVAEYCHPPLADMTKSSLRKGDEGQVCLPITNVHKRIGSGDVGRSGSPYESTADESSLASFSDSGSFKSKEGFPAAALPPLSGSSFKNKSSPSVPPIPRLVHSEHSPSQMMSAVNEICLSVRSGGNTPRSSGGGGDSPSSLFVSPQRKMMSIQSLRDVAAEAGGLTRPQQVIPLQVGSVDSLETSGEMQSIASIMNGEDGRIHIPRRKESLKEMGIIENNVLKNGPITHRRIISFSFDRQNHIEQIRMMNQ